MAQKLKFGNGVWANKEGSTLAYNDENGNYKPLPFNFTRSSSATRVNKQGLIEVVKNNEPRIDYKDSAKGALILEPSRTNINTNSESFNTYSLVGGSVISDNLISPSGFLTADSFVEDSNNSQHRIRKDIAVTAGNYTVSCFVKGTDRYLSIYPQSAGVAYSVFDLNNGTITKTGGANYIDSKIENYGNGWYRCILTYSVSTGNSYVHLYLSNIASGTGAEAPTYTGNGSIMNFYGLQLEAGSYATSYIPTISAVTRVADVCNNGGNAQVINSTEGVLYVETKGFIDVLSSSVYIQLSKNGEASFNNSLTIQHRNNGYLRVYVNGTATSDIHFNEDIDFTENHKIAVLYKLNGYKLFIDGVSKSLFGTPTQTVFSGLDNLSFDLRDALNWNGSIKDVRVYNTALTDQELIALTS